MAAAVDDGGTDWSIARRRSPILSGKKEGKPYVREDFTDCLNDVLEGLKNRVWSLGQKFRVVSDAENRRR